MLPNDTLAEFTIRQVPAEKLITDLVGLVIQPDAATIRKSYELAASLMPKTSEVAVAPGSLPHMTLTQCTLRNAPRERLAEFIEQLEEQLRGRSIPLSTVVAFGAGFLFWCTDHTAPERRSLQHAHEYAITLADGLLDPVANAAVVEGTIRLFNNDLVLVGNARTYGYAMVRDRYLPHITLGFDPRLAVDRQTGPISENQTHLHAMQVERVVLAKMGSHGRVDYVFSL